MPVWLLRSCGLGAAFVVGLCAAASAQIMIIGNDEKASFANGTPSVNPPGHDTLTIVDMSKPAGLRIVATIPLDNSVIGPPTNLAITPDRSLALVANSVKGVEKDGKPAVASDDRLFVIDLKANPPKVAATVNLGKRPSGMAIAPNGKVALVTNRDDGTISVLTINGTEVKVADTVKVGEPADSVSAVAIAPDGKRVLATKPAANKVALLTLDGEKLTYDKRDLPVGIFPYNVVIAPNGKLALTADNGNGGGSDGNADTVSVIDLEADPVRVIDHVTVGDSPEGLAISPKGNLAVAIEARGSNGPKTNWFYHQGGAVTVLAISGKKVTRVGEVTVGGLPEGAVFSADGSYLYVGNFMDKDLSVLRVNGTRLGDTGQRVKLPGQTASMRGGPQ